MRDQSTIDEFHKLFYDAALDTWASTFWLGVAVEKYPGDLWIYQEIIRELQPDFIIETGTRFGGSALFMASICDLIGHGHVITVDLEELASSDTVRPAHARITYLTGSSTSPEVLSEVRERIASAARVMVVLDSDHQMTHVLDEMKLYADLVTDDSYLIVEDTNINGHPVATAFGHGPMEAVQVFLAGNDGFLVDRSREKFLMSFNPGGFLRKTVEGGLRSRLLTAEGTIEQLQSDMAEHETEARTREAEIATQQAAETARQAQTLAEQAAASEAAVQAARVEESVRLTGLHRLELEERDALIVEKEQQLALLQDQLIAAEAVSQVVVGSTSWRLTAPLRKAKRLLKGD